MSAGWGKVTWGFGAWGLLGNQTVIVTGQSLTGALGTADAGDFTTYVSVTGIALTTALGNEGTSGEINSGWGRIEWGINAWGEFGTALPTGNALTTNLGSVTPRAGAVATNSSNANQTATFSIGTTNTYGGVFVSVTGIAMTSAQGTADAGPDAMLTGIGMSMGLGSVDAFNTEGWGRYSWGQFDWGVAGEWVGVPVTGIAMSASLGSLTTAADATVVANTLSVAQVTLGNADPAPDAMIIGNAALLSLGTLSAQADVVISLTGIAMTASVGTAVADAVSFIEVTGIAMTAALNSVTTTAEGVVVLTGNALTIEAASVTPLIWSEVDTGSAPIDPPGWREVAA